LISCLISAFNAARSTVGVTFGLVLGEDVGCSSLERSCLQKYLSCRERSGWTSLSTLHLIGQENSLDHTHIEGGLWERMVDEHIFYLCLDQRQPLQ